MGVAVSACGGMAPSFSDDPLSPPAEQSRPLPHALRDPAPPTSEVSPVNPAAAVTVSAAPTTETTSAQQNLDGGTPSASTQVAIELLARAEGPPAAPEICGWRPGDPYESPVFASWEQSPECRARQTAWTNVPHEHLRCSSDQDCVLVTHSCFLEPLNRHAASLTRYRNPPCGNPRAGACRQRTDLVPVCVHGCCQAGQSRADPRLDSLQQVLETRARDRAATCASESGPTGASSLVLVFDPDGGLVRVDEAAPFQSTARGTCMADGFRDVHAPASEAGLLARIPFRLPP